jgi:hypothetical protein
MTAFDFFTIGHSNIPAERFTALLRGAGVEAVADVRSIPASRFCPWFSAENLAPLLTAANIDYLFLGDELGGRPRDPSLYCDGVANYEAMAHRPNFQVGLDRLLAQAGQHRLCLMCSERDPLDCHRCLLVARMLAARGVRVGHILHDGGIESHGAIERQLLEAAGESGDLFVTGQDQRLAAAYRRRARAVAYRLNRANKTSGANRTPDRAVSKMANKGATTIDKKIRNKKKSR